MSELQVRLLLPFVQGFLDFLLETGFDMDFAKDPLGDPGYNGFLIPLASVWIFGDRAACLQRHWLPNEANQNHYNFD